MSMFLCLTLFDTNGKNENKIQNVIKFGSKGVRRRNKYHLGWIFSMNEIFVFEYSGSNLIPI